ncbi:MAG: RIP metalloprotease RseP [Termitinemataceae bacterium]|nr:MAG: RIP metalloprotease RseP [Termitinemataceae bacterium]
MILKMILGLIGLGIVVFIHELGHFLAARSVGIGVDAFSIGWGKPILKKKIGDVEYRLGPIPLGGYCKMHGENDFKAVWENFKNNVPKDKSTFLGAHPLAGMWTAFAGPFFNILFAVAVFSVMWGIGFQYKTMSNKIVLVQDVIKESDSSPAQRAGLLTGDKIIKIGKKNIENWYDIQSEIAVSAKKEMPVTILRGSEIIQLTVKPDLEKSTGAGKIGIYFWGEPVIEEVIKDSAAEKAGIKAGDRIVKINGHEINYSVAIYSVIAGDNPAEGLNIEIQRGNEVINTTLFVPQDEKGDTGIIWQSIHYATPDYSLFGAIGKGIAETCSTLSTSVRSIALLFGGIDLTKAVSGPIRITYMAGDIAASGFKQSIGTGIRGIVNFLAIISIALAVMNLLPLPILDGGLILIFLIQLVRRKPLNPRFISVFQTAGIVLIAGIMLFALFGDVMFLVKG